jgi:hypothetical protein
MNNHYHALARRLNILKEQISPKLQQIDQIIVFYTPYKDDEEVDPADNPKMEVRSPGLLFIFYRAHTEEEQSEIDAKARVLIDAYKQGLTRTEVKQ